MGRSGRIVNPPPGVGSAPSLPARRFPCNFGPMPITPDDVRAIARLARLELSDEEVERFGAEMAKILDYVAQLEEVETASAAGPEDPDRPLRPDVVEPWPDPKPLHEAAPEIEDGYVKVPRVVE